MSNDRKTIWQRIAEQQDRYIGGTLIDLGDGDPLFGPVPSGGFRTTITALRERPNGDSGDRYFEVIGERFGCGGSAQYLGVRGVSQYGPGMALENSCTNHRWDIVERHGIAETRREDA